MANEKVQKILIGSETYDIEDPTKAEKKHASNTEDYGLGNGSLYGHLRLSDTTSASLDKTGGTAATPKCVYDGIDKLESTVKTSVTNITNKIENLTNSVQTYYHKQLQDLISGRDDAINFHFYDNRTTKTAIIDCNLNLATLHQGAESIPSGYTKIKSITKSDILNTIIKITDEQILLFELNPISVNESVCPIRFFCKVIFYKDGWLEKPNVEIWSLNPLGKTVSIGTTVTGTYRGRILYFYGRKVEV